jgi:hypothetical protein
MIGIAMAPTLALQTTDDPKELIRAFGNLSLDPKAKAERKEVGFDDACRDRVMLAHRLVACGKRAVDPLKEALKSDNRHVRAMAAELLGVAGEASAAPALAEAARDGDATVRIYALQSLAWLKAEPKAIEAALEDRNGIVRFVAGRAQEQLREVSKVREAYAPLRAEDLGRAAVGKPAPDFGLPPPDGKPWRLSEQKEPLVLMFQPADW